MSVTITHEPKNTEPGQWRKYGVEVRDGDWARFAEIVEEGVKGEKVSVTVNGGDVLSFQTARERMSWSDGFKQGVRSATEETVIIDWLEQWLKQNLEQDELEKQQAGRREGIYREKMSPKTAARCARLAQLLTRWRKS